MEFLLETSCLARKIKFLFNEETVIFRNAYTLPDWYQPCSVMISSCSRTLKDRNEISSEIAKGFLSHSLTLVSCSQPVPSTALDSLKNGTQQIQSKEESCPSLLHFFFILRENVQGHSWRFVFQLHKPRSVSLWQVQNKVKCSSVRQNSVCTN